LLWIVALAACATETPGPAAPDGSTEDGPQGLAQLAPHWSQVPLPPVLVDVPDDGSLEPNDWLETTLPGSPQEPDDDEPEDQTESEPCEPRGIDTVLELTWDDWSLETAATGLGEPTALDVDHDGTFYVGAGLGATDARSVLRVSPDGTVSQSGSIADPDGVGLDADGVPHAAGSDDIWRLGSLSGGVDERVATLSGENVNDLHIDRDGDGSFYVGLDDGQVVRVYPDGTQVSLIGGASGGRVMTLDPEGSLWVLRPTTGDLDKLDPDSGEVLLSVDLPAQAIPGLIRVNRITSDPDGVLYMSAYIDGDGARIAAWDPDEPDTHDIVIDNMAGDQNPDDLNWSPDGRCLYVSQPLIGTVIRTCACD